MPRSESCTPHKAAIDTALSRALPWGILLATRLPAHILQKRARRVELRAKARPVSRFQALDSSMVVVERLSRPICRGARERRSYCSARGRLRNAGFHEECR